MSVAVISTGFGGDASAVMKESGDDEGEDAAAPARGGGIFTYLGLYRRRVLEVGEDAHARNGKWESGQMTEWDDAGALNVLCPLAPGRLPHSHAAGAHLLCREALMLPPNYY